MYVDIQVNNNTIRGIIKNVLPPKHSNNEIIDVELMTGTIGSLIRIVPKSELKEESFRFYNLFFHSRFIFTIWDKYTKETFTIQSISQRTKEVERIAFLFSDESLAHEILSELNQENLAVRRISRQKPIVENFTDENISSFRLNEEQKVMSNRLSALENYYNQF